MNAATRTDEVWSIDDLELELRKLPGVRAAGFEDCGDVLLVQLHVDDHTDRADRADHTDRADQPVPVSASRIAARHAGRPVAVEVVRWRSAPSPSAARAMFPAPSHDAAPEVSAAEPKATAAEPKATAAEPEPTTAEARAPEARPETTEPAETPEPSRTRLLAVLAFPDTDELEVHLVLGARRTIGRAAVSRGIEGAVEATINAVRELGTGIHPRLRWANTIVDAGLGGGDREVVAVALDGVDARSPVHFGLAAGTSLIDAAARATLDALNRRMSREP